VFSCVAPIACAERASTAEASPVVAQEASSEAAVPMAKKAPARRREKGFIAGLGSWTWLQWSIGGGFA
jgi:hypothetical protein